jgi:hypothetical protein
MTNQDISPDQRLLHKIQGRLAMSRLRFEVEQGTRTGSVNVATGGPPLPFLYQG